MNTSLHLLSLKKHIHDAKVYQVKLSSQTRALLNAKNRISRKVAANHHYCFQCEQDKQQLRKMALSRVICQMVGEQRYFNYSEISALTQSLNRVTPLSWSIELFNGGAWIYSPYNHIMPAMTFYVSSDGIYRLSSFSLNINRGNSRIMVN